MRRLDLPKGREERGDEQCQGEVEQGLLQGYTGANPEMSVLLLPG